MMRVLRVLVLLLLLFAPCSNSLSLSTPFSAGRAVSDGQRNPFENPPYLSLITNRNSCNNSERFDQSCATLELALKTNKVNLVTVRITPSTAEPSLVADLIQFLVDLNLCAVVVHQDWIPQAIQAKAHGIHIKEDNHQAIPSIRRRFAQHPLPPPLIGMTAHSMSSAVYAARYQPDYLLAGSCFVSGDSHPEKQEVEGPELPGRVAKALFHACPVLAIGGIEVDNCQTPMAQGAQGVTAIKSVLQSSDPAASVYQLSDRIEKAYLETTKKKAVGP